MAVIKALAKYRTGSCTFSTYAYECIKNAVTKLPPQEMELILSVYYKGVSLKNYASKKGMSYQQASRKKDFVLYKLGNQFKQ